MVTVSELELAGVLQGVRQMATVSNMDTANELESYSELELVIGQQ